MKRLPISTFNIQVDQVKSGYYSAAYFNKLKAILGKHPNAGKDVTMQVFQRKEAILCGVDEALAHIFLCANNVNDLEIKALYDGDEILPWEPVLRINGDLVDFAQLESVYLGILARRTKVATNTNRVVNAANGKDVLFFADRFDHYLNQSGDGYAAHIGGAKVFATDAMGAWIGQVGSGTMPHALIAAFGGSLEAACEAYSNTFDEDVIALVDFNNDCVSDTIRAAELLGEKLWGVRLDTSGNMIDQSLDPRALTAKGEASTGVNQSLVENVRNALDKRGFNYVKIVVSGGFDPSKIKAFEEQDVPVDAYGVGSSLLNGSFDYTADVVAPVAKVGRKFIPSDRLDLVNLNSFEV